MPVKNRFNNINSKEWLPFQKSWFAYENIDALYRSNIRFFTQKNEESQAPIIYYKGNESALFESICNQEERLAIDSLSNKNPMFALLDLRSDFKSLEEYLNKKAEILLECKEIFKQLQHRKFLCILIRNIEAPSFEPIAWDLAQSLKHLFSLKDEKIGGVKTSDLLQGNEVFYALYFRKDEKSKGSVPNLEYKYKGLNRKQIREDLGAWQVVRPPRRKKDEILHPAKYPEALIESFIGLFTTKNQNVFDPMSGTGSSQLAALKLERNAYGIELSPFFHKIAIERCKGFKNNYDLKLADAKNVTTLGLPKMDYLITSPPYWDMLNMKGAEYQARRKEKGLQLNYSDHESDLGNVEDYYIFLDELVEVYKLCDTIMNVGAHATIIVKNIKKKGSNYPFAWDLSQRLCEMGWKILPEFFWCQDDINIAPYGYGNTWVSNTFHQYCLNFKKVK